MLIQGTLKYIEIEGGHWTLTADDGIVYDLGATIRGNHVDGESVELDIHTTDTALSIFMHGRPATVKDYI